MKTEEGKKYIIEEEKLNEILENIVKLSSNNVTELMYNKMMHRTLFRCNNSDNDGNTSWIRVRVGDINCDGTSQCTVTYKNKLHKEEMTNSSRFIAEDYYSVVQFFKDIGLVLVSEQETLRSKYVFYYENVKYIICFDVWPHLDGIVFVTISAEDNINEDGFVEVCKSIKLTEIALKTSYVDIDRAYQDRFNKKASEIQQLRFKLSIF